MTDLPYVAGPERVRTFPTAPDDLDPLTAPDELLWEHGIPARPDPIAQPEFARFWDRMYARGVKFVEAQLAVDQRRIGHNPLRRRGGDFGSGDWAGAMRVQVAGSPYAQPATFVAGEWTVPTVYGADPDGPLSQLSVGFWVGIDGQSQHQVLQGGVAGVLNGGFFGNEVEYYAWGEWYTDEVTVGVDPVRFNGFPVAPGDVISCVVMAAEPTAGFVSIANLTHGYGSSMWIPAPGNIRSAGQSVEWVVEQVNDALPAFTPIVFAGCVAGSATEVFGTVIGEQINIYGDDHRPATDSFTFTDHAVVINWVGYGKPGADLRKQ
jgi:peptidase A4-like protein